MFAKLIAAWKKYRSTIKFSCWLRSANGSIAHAKVKAVPTEFGYEVTSEYRKGSSKPIIKKVAMTHDEFFEFYRQFA